jgi:hypothetical protein
MASSLRIELQCPQCGAPAELDETDHLFICDYCRVRSFIISRDFYRYILPDKAPPNTEIIYFPYWRFKGMVFACNVDGLTERFIDVTHQGLLSTAFPASMGLRTQALKLQFLSPDTKGRFIKPLLTHRSGWKLFEKRLCESLAQPVYHQAHIGDAISLIYAPFYIKDDRIFDAILNQPLKLPALESQSLDKYIDTELDWSVQFLSTLCPHCGWDLSGERNSVVLICRNCQTMWKARKGELARVNFGSVATENKDLTYFPFWQIQTQTTGLDLQSYADLVKVANLPKAIQQEWHDKLFYFWIPGFKVRPQLFLRISQHMTLCQPDFEITSHIPENDMYPVTMPVNEAVESLKINLASLYHIIMHK